MTPYEDGWYLFWYQWKEEPYSCTLVANTRVCTHFGALNINENVRRLQLPPPHGLEGRVLKFVLHAG